MKRWPVIYWGDFDYSKDYGKYRKTSDNDEMVNSDYSRYDIVLLG